LLLTIELSTTLMQRLQGSRPAHVQDYAGEASQSLEKAAMPSPDGLFGQLFTCTHGGYPCTGIITPKASERADHHGGETTPERLADITNRFASPARYAIIARMFIWLVHVATIA
jgi:hypothetical protein